MTSIKWYAIGAAFIAYTAMVFWLGSLPSKEKLDHSLAQQSATVAAALLAQRKVTDAETDRLNAVVAKYEAEPIDPIVPGTAERLHDYEVRECALSSPAANTSGTSGTPAVPRSDPELERLSQAAFDAGAHDAKELAALQTAWPSQSQKP